MTPAPPDLDAIRKRCEAGSHVMYLQADVRALLAALSTQAETIERLTRERDQAFAQRDGTAAGRDWHIDNAAELLARAEAAEASAAALRERVGKLEKALAPFAELNEALEGTYSEYPDSSILFGHNFITISHGDFRCAARALLKGAPANVE